MKKGPSGKRMFSFNLSVYGVEATNTKRDTMKTDYFEKKLFEHNFSNHNFSLSFELLLSYLIQTIL